MPDTHSIGTQNPQDFWKKADSFETDSLHLINTNYSCGFMPEHPSSILFFFFFCTSTVTFALFDQTAKYEMLMLKTESTLLLSSCAGTESVYFYNLVL